MAFAIHLKRSAEKELDNFPSDIYKKVIRRIISLKDNPRPRGVKKLTGKN
jgi:mRNA-degrading endonuclease RelE of RelBE toxin-antitoxin system